jgi:tryptophan synthase alpha chain
VVIGSRIVQLLEETPPEAAVATLTEFVAGVRRALDAA